MSNATQKQIRDQLQKEVSQLPKVVPDFTKAEEEFLLAVQQGKRVIKKKKRRRS